jgi:hypothetical protein
VRVEYSIVDLPRIVSNRSLGGPDVTEIEITFSDPMSESVLSVDNYQMEDPYAVTNVMAQTADRSVVIVQLDPRHPVGAIGKTARLTVQNVFDQQGRAIDSTSASILIGGPFASLASAYVYPNPFAGRGPDGREAVMFAGLPEKVKIRLFDLRGVLIREINHDNSLGGTLWDMTNADGDRVASGVYIYTLESAGETVRGKLAILR